MAEPAITFEESLQLRQIAEDHSFENIHLPWTWPGTAVIPGGLLMSECAVAACKTIDESYTIASIQAQFIAGASAKLPIVYRVTALSTGRRFAVRLVVASQENRNVLSATLTFAGPAAKSTPAMTYSVTRATTHIIDTITLNDLEPITPLGPFMRFQRLPVTHAESAHHSPGTGTGTGTGITLSAAHISPSLAQAPAHPIHTLGLINLSDYHVLDTPMQLSNLTFGMFAPGDVSRTPTNPMAKLFTSLNHAIYFHDLRGFRADQMCYIEGTSAWAGDGRACVQTKIFSKDGKLRASCVQDAFFVLNGDAVKSKI